MQPEPTGSLWQRVPKSTKLELIPILTTGLLARSGALTAALLVRLHDGVRWSEPANKQAVSDLTGVFILLNFVVILWFGYATLNEAVRKGGDISINAKLIGLGSAFVTSLELYSYALKSEQPERLAYAIAILFYVFFVPFFLAKPLFKPAAGATAAPPAVHALAAYELVVYALVVGVAATIVGSAFFVLLNEGVGVLGYEAIKPIVSSFAHHGKAEFWGINPAVLGLGWLTAVFITADASRAMFGNFGLDRRGRLVTLAGAFLVSVLIAIAVIGDTSIAPVGGLQRFPLAALKAIAAVAMTTAFLLAFLASRRLSQRIGLRSAVTAGGCAIFAGAGVLFGAMLLSIRTVLGDQVVPNLNLLWMHGGGFALAYLSGLAATRLLRHRLPDVIGPFNNEAISSAPAGVEHA